MSLTETIPIPLGFTAPEFSLLNVQLNSFQSLDELCGERLTVVMFICNHCPYVIHVRQALITLAKDYQDQGVAFIAISSNDPIKYPEDAPEKMKQLADELDFPFPYLFDQDQSVAKDYHAACTPDFSVFDAELKCIYRGRLDGSTPGNDTPLTGMDLRRALDAGLSNKAPIQPQLPSMGCNIKWR